VQLDVDSLHDHPVNACRLGAGDDDLELNAVAYVDAVFGHGECVCLPQKDVTRTACTVNWTL
jgi:hypothetical protein